LLIACKYEEIYFPEIRDFVYVCDRAYNSFQILAMESEILSTLSFIILPCSPLRFLQILNKELNLSLFNYHFCLYMIDLMLLDYKNLKYLPSLTICSCIFIILKIGRINLFDLEYFKKFCLIKNTTQGTGRKELELEIKECASIICFILDNLDSYPFLRKIRDKYSKTEYSEVSNFRLG
jgi:hypothetical protein